MSDAAITTIITGLVTITTMVIGFLNMYVKLRHARLRAEVAAFKADEAVVKVGVVERKIDHNTSLTQSVESKANTIVKQTNGSLEQVRSLVSTIADRVSKLEEYNHESAHRLFNTINAMNLKIERILAMRETKITPPVANQSGKP